MNSGAEKKHTLLRITQGRDVPQFLVERVMLSIVELEKAVYKSSLQGNTKRYCDWYGKNPDILTILTPGILTDVIGSLISMPIDNFAYKQLENGLWTDLDIESEHVLTYNNPGFYSLCLNTLLIDKSRVRGISPLKLIVDAFFQKLLELAENNIIIENIVTDAVTVEGERLARVLGMKPAGNKLSADYLVHVMTLWPPQDITQRLFFTSQIRLISKYRYLWEKSSCDCTVIYLNSSENN